MSIDIFNNLVACYRMDDNAESKVVRDSSGNNYHGTSQRNTNLMHAAGKMGGALSFLGDEETIKDYINTNQTFQAVLQSDFSINAWIKPATNDGMAILGFFENWNDISNQELYIKLNTGQSITFRFYHTDDGVELNTEENIYATNIWQMITVTFKEVGVDDYIACIYYNGNLIATKTDVRGRPDIELETTLAIGAIHNGGDNQAEGFSDYMEGVIDDVRIFNKALSADEILWLYNKLKQVGAGEGLISAQSRMTAKDESLSIQSRITANLIAEPDDI